MRPGLLTLLLCGVALGSCDREKREFRAEPAPAASSQAEIAMVPFSPGGTPPITTQDAKGQSFLGNAYHLSQGKTLFKQMNCSGCHANGGGGSGPALMDDRWIYGSRVENVAASILEGRPNGMPSFRGKLTDDQVWELAVYVLSMSGNAPSSAAPQRDDAMNPHPSESRQPTQTPVPGGSVPTSAQTPQ
jgi:cytochrome c oxidase cbb3-type subunit 3